MDANDFTNAKATEVACAVRSLYANIGKCKFKWWEQMVKSETKKKLFVWENEQKVLGGVYRINIITVIDLFLCIGCQGVFFFELRRNSWFQVFHGGCTFRLNSPCLLV